MADCQAEIKETLAQGKSEADAKKSGLASQEYHQNLIDMENACLIANPDIESLLLLQLDTVGWLKIYDISLSNVTLAITKLRLFMDNLDNLAKEDENNLNKLVGFFKKYHQKSI